MSLVGFAFLISITFLLLTVAGQVLLVIYHRRKRLKYTLLNGVDHFSKLAAGFSLLLAVFALLYGAYSQEASTKEAEEMNRQSVFIARSQTALLQNTVEVLSKVSADLKVNADASVKAAESLKEQLRNETEMQGRRPRIQIALAVVDPNGGEGTLIGVMGNQALNANSTYWADKGQNNFILRVQTANFGNATLQEGSLILRTAALDGKPNPTVALVGVFGKNLFEENGDSSGDPLDSDMFPISFSNLPPNTIKDYQIRIGLPRSNGDSQRLFSLNVSFAGDAKPQSGIVTFRVRFSKEYDTETTRGQKLLDDRQFEDALKLFQSGAEKGDANAMDDLAFMYEGQSGVKQDCPQALHWYNAAIGLGNQVAMSNLGWLYEQGTTCVKQDYKRARELYTEAAAAGGSDGLSNLGYLYMMGHLGRGGKPDYRQARELFSRAIVLNNDRAMNNLGYMYENAWGSDRDYALAQYWYEKAASAGNSTAMINRLLTRICKTVRFTRISEYRTFEGDRLFWLPRSVGGGRLGGSANAIGLLCTAVVLHRLMAS